MTKAIYFDMDGTLADLYGVGGWLADLQAERVRPYKEAEPLLNMQVLARKLNQLQRMGWHIGIVSWLSKTGSPAYNMQVVEAKKKWLKLHLKSVHFDEFEFLTYGTPKQENVKFNGGILFDDEFQNRKNWNGMAYDVENILEILREL